MFELSKCLRQRALRARLLIPLRESGSHAPVLGRLIQNILKLPLDISGDSCKPLFGSFGPYSIMVYLAFEFFDPAAA
jgi:hypothetical protein